MILAFIDGSENLHGSEMTYEESRRRRESRRGSADNISLGIDLVSRAGGENRPVRRGLSKEKRNALTIAAAAVDDADEEGDYTPKVVHKTPAEIERIANAVRVNFLFAHLNEQQRAKIFDVMQRVPVKKDEVVIRQGDQGDWFYVVDRYSRVHFLPGLGPCESADRIGPPRLPPCIVPRSTRVTA